MVSVVQMKDCNKTNHADHCLSSDTLYITWHIQSLFYCIFPSSMRFSIDYLPFKRADTRQLFWYQTINPTFEHGGITKKVCGGDKLCNYCCVNLYNLSWGTLDLVCPSKQHMLLLRNIYPPCWKAPEQVIQRKHVMQS